jgi:hypothetical protein
MKIIVSEYSYDYEYSVNFKKLESILWELKLKFILKVEDMLN